MAQFTIENYNNIQNRFLLLLFVSHRTRELLLGAQPLINNKEDKAPIIALEEISGNHLDLNKMLGDIIKKYRGNFISKKEEYQNETEDFDKLFNEDKLKEENKNLYKDINLQDS